MKDFYFRLNGQEFKKAMSIYNGVEANCRKNKEIDQSVFNAYFILVSEKQLELHIDIEHTKEGNKDNIVVGFKYCVIGDQIKVGDKVRVVSIVAEQLLNECEIIYKANGINDIDIIIN